MAASSFFAALSAIVTPTVLRVGNPSLLVTSFVTSGSPQINALSGRVHRLFMSKCTATTDFEKNECALVFETLPHRGAQVRLSNIRSCDADDAVFIKKLQESLDYWTKNYYTSAWVHLPSCRASLVEMLTSSEKDDGVSISNFELHHVNVTEQTIVLKQWLLPGKEDKVPPFATHQVGCAGLVVDERNRILLVREWSGAWNRRVPSTQWKLPGGLLDLGESFGDASRREVLEETGIETEFECLVGFWHRHGLTFGKSDVYVVCLLCPQSHDIRFDPTEISDAKWMPIDEFLRTQDHPLILHVLEHAFHLTKNDDKSPLIRGERIQPVAPITEGFVQWPYRYPYPTYTSRIIKKSD